MSLRMFLLGSALMASSLLGCAHKQTPPADKPAAATPAAAPTPAPASTPEAATPTPDPAPTAAPTPAPECTEPKDCASKGTPAKGMQWACTDSKCAEEKKGHKKAKK